MCKTIQTLKMKISHFVVICWSRTLTHSWYVYSACTFKFLSNEYIVLCTAEHSKRIHYTISRFMICSDRTWRRCVCAHTCFWHAMWYVLIDIHTCTHAHVRTHTRTHTHITSSKSVNSSVTKRTSQNLLYSVSHSVSSFSGTSEVG